MKQYLQSVLFPLNLCMNFHLVPVSLSAFIKWLDNQECVLHRQDHPQRRTWRTW